MYRERIPKCADQILWNLLFMKLAEQTINTSHQMLCPCLAAILTSPGKYQDTESWSRHCVWIWRGIVLMLISILTPVIFAALSTPLTIDSKITPACLTKLTGGGARDPGYDATIWCQLRANQRPGSRSRDLKLPIRGQLTTSPWRGVNQSQILIFSSSARRGKDRG